MTVLWPHSLWLLAALPVLTAGYVWQVRRDRRASAVHGRLLAQALSGRGARRHVAPALVALALASLMVAMARPQAMLTLPSAHPTIILAIDVSGSMQADDVAPTRLGAAQAAAREFARNLPADARLGLVAFSDAAQMVQAPTLSRQAIVDAIDTLQPQLGTAIGSGLLTSLQAIFPEGRFDPDYAGDASAGASSRRRDPAGDAGAVVLLTDGQNTDGPPPENIALIAAKHGVRVYTVGVGTPAGRIYKGLTGSMLVGIDEAALKTISSLTKGEYFYARTAPDLQKIYANLGKHVVLARDAIELSAFFCAAAALALVLSATLSLLSFGRVA
ncbi:MAG: VWA domain-containing protein [Clostridia bacterium]